MKEYTRELAPSKTPVRAVKAAPVRREQGAQAAGLNEEDVLTMGELANILNEKKTPPRKRLGLKSSSTKPK
jgi:hypothetical protein